MANKITTRHLRLRRKCFLMLYFMYQWKFTGLMMKNNRKKEKNQNKKTKNDKKCICNIYTISIGVHRKDIEKKNGT